MTPNRLKLGRAVTFMKYFASVVSLMFLPKILIWNKITFLTSKSLNFAELVEKEVMESIFKIFTNILLFIQFIAAYLKELIAK